MGDGRKKEGELCLIAALFLRTRGPLAQFLFTDLSVRRTTPSDCCLGLAVGTHEHHRTNFFARLLVFILQYGYCLLVDLLHFSKLFTRPDATAEDPEAMNSGRVRSASHAGLWYSDNPKTLDAELSEWLNKAGTPYQPTKSARAIITPHAGYSYCGDTAAFAFKQVIPEVVNRIFVMGPSHVVCLNNCALTTCSRYKTPLGNLHVDQKTNEDLMATNAFSTMNFHDEESEHSIEMQMPYIAKIMENRSPDSFSIIPILIGSLTQSSQAMYGKIFAKYIADPRNLFVISSDFCHWGHRFHFTPYDNSDSRAVHEQIAAMDKEGMDAISTVDPHAFTTYLKKTQNTICGRNPISVMLQAAEHFRQMNNHTAEFRFLKYSQSNKCRNMKDSSVSYAAGALYINPK
ncbi:hypothetical protein QR680_004970 [Steinernema hermaphroditum]|uniref:Protein MEMO1 n=1 Tax=Steinernema hermaphroditum TaxID=289476 RepID=A0AA39HQE8_9BILA|nr:hypothetical protein QR680_004970 [Steinernema hermaphroditum]